MTQAITLRLITRQAGGGEIVRTRRLDGSRAMIGRAPGCDIHLPDLAVDPEHALLKVIGENRVSVESLTGQPFSVDGKTALHVELDVAASHVVSFGDFDLAPGLGGEDDIAITVVRREEDHASATSVFSLRASLFGRRRMAWTLGLTILALCLILPLALAGNAWLGHSHIHPDQQWSSGPLSKAHAFLEKDCQACHQQAFVAVRDQACLTCHTATADPQRTAALNDSLRRRGSPFIPRLIFDHAEHDRLLRAMPPPPTVTGWAQNAVAVAFNHPRDRCASCHREHAGPHGPIAEADRPLKPTLVVANDCASCHARLKMRLSSTTLIDTPDWNRHPDFRPLITVSAGGPRPILKRIALGDRPQEHNGLIFSHSQHLDPTGAVARMGVSLGAGRGYGGALTCFSCHRPQPGAAAYKPIEMERDCGACHSLAFAQAGGQPRLLPHGDPKKVMEALQTYYGGGAAAPAGEPLRRLPGAFRPHAAAPSPAPQAPGLAAGAFRAAFSAGGACYDCHAISWNGDGPLGVRVAPVHLAQRFLPSGAFDHSVPAHRGEGLGAFACVDCHAAKASDRSEDVLLPAIAKCASCHGKTEHQTPAAAKTDCSECHSYHRPGKATPTGQARTFEAIFGGASGPARGMPGS
jgi:hypothetical protein